MEDLTTKVPPEFVLTRGAVKAIDLLNDPLYSKIFTEKSTPCDDIILIYRLFYMLIDRHDVSDIKENNAFWAKSCNYFINDCNNEIGKIIHNLVKTINFSSENLLHIQRLVGNSTHKITPSFFSKVCGTTGLFVFLLKDAFEYVGIIVDNKKTPPYNQYKLEKYHLDVLNERLEKIKALQASMLK
jgi:hypothetical protein